jgi:hypothetical protein
MNTSRTVAVETFGGHSNALLMKWQHDPRPSDVRTAFDTILSELRGTDDSVYIIVDLMQNPRFPLSETMFSALDCYRHPRLKGWLILGGGRTARSIEMFLSRMTGKRNVHWFETEADILSYLQQTSEREETQLLLS